MNCPVCAAGLQAVQAGPLELGDCPRCGGLFLDQRLLRALGDPVPALGRAMAGFLGRPPLGRELPENLRCPKCRTRMRRSVYRCGPSIEIRECLGCSSLWLDPGNLGVLRQTFHDETTRHETVERMVASISGEFDDLRVGGRSGRSRVGEARVALRREVLDRLTRLVSDWPA